MLASVIPSGAEPLQLLRAAGPELAALVPEGTRERLRRAAESLALPTQTLCLELLLGRAEQRVDLALCLFRHAGAALGDALRELTARHRSHPEWEQCLALVDHWLRQRGRALADVPFACLAFDLQTDDPKLPAPCLSFCADPSFLLRRLGLPAPAPELPWVLDLTRSCHALLRHEPLPEECAARIRACLTASEGVEARHVSWMLAREPVTLKLDLSLPADQLSTFLSRASWPGDALAVQEQVSMLAPWQARTQLNYVVHPAPSPALEIEFCTAADADDTTRRAALLEQLVERGLVSAEKASALLAIARQPLISDEQGRLVARNWYLKVRFEAAGTSLAKAYLGIMPRGEALGGRVASPAANLRPE